MNPIRIYTDLDSIFDTRRGIITHIAKEFNSSFTWDLFKPIYDERRIDIFNRPSLGITPEKYEERFKARSVEDWADENECYFYPSNLLSEILQIVRSIEYGSTSTILASRLSMSINLYPFSLSTALQDELTSHVLGAFKIPVDLSLVYIPYEAQTGPYLNNFDYVFRYHHLLRPESESWFKTIMQIARPGTKYIVPDILAKEFDSEGDNAVLYSMSIEDHIKRCSATLGGGVIFIPTGNKLFASIETE